MKNLSAAAAAALLLVGCNSQDKAGNGGAESNGAGNAAGVQPTQGGAQAGASNSIAPTMAGDPNARTIQPGEWEMTSEMVSIEAPGAPPAMAAQLRAEASNQRQTRRQCITAADVANAARSLVGRDATAQGCRFSDTIFAGGVIRIAAACRQPGGPQSMQMAVQGGFTATQIDAGIRLSVTGPAPNGRGLQAVNMTGRMSGRRIGECPARGSVPPRTIAPSPMPPATPAPRP